VIARSLTACASLEHSLTFLKSFELGM
jgi:hypothetical protein